MKAPQPQTEPLVACVDGPMVGQWYTEADWRERVAVAQRMLDKGQRPAACLAYKPGRDEVTGPHGVARALRWQR